MSHLSQSNINLNQSNFSQNLPNNAPKKLQKSQYYRYSENYYHKTLGEGENPAQKSDFQEKVSKIKRVPLVFLYENTERNFGRLCDRYFCEYSKYHHQQLYGTNKNYDLHRAQMFNQFQFESNDGVVGEDIIGPEIVEMKPEDVADNRTFFKYAANHMVITFKSIQITISEQKEKQKPKKIFTTLIDFSNLQRLISDKTTLDIVSAIKSGIDYNQVKKELAFNLEVDSKSLNNKNKKSPRENENENFPEFTHSYIKINENLELMVEIKFPSVEFYLNAYAYSQTQVLQSAEIKSLLEKNFSNIEEYYKKYFREDDFLKVKTFKPEEVLTTEERIAETPQITLENLSIKPISDDYDFKLIKMKRKYDTLEEYYKQKILKEVIREKDKYLTITFHAHVITLVRKINEEGMENKRKKHEEAFRNKRFLTINEFIQMINLTKSSDIVDVVKEYVNIDEKEEEIKETPSSKKINKSKINLALPEPKKNLEFFQITEENIKNNILNYMEIISGENLFKIEPPTLSIYNPTSKEIWKEALSQEFLNELITKKFMCSFGLELKNKSGFELFG